MVHAVLLPKNVFELVFYSSFKNFLFIKIFKTDLKKIEKINCKANAKTISTFEFSTLHTKLPLLDLISVLHHVVDFALRGGGDKNKYTLVFLETKLLCHKPKNLNFFIKII